MPRESATQTRRARDINDAAYPSWDHHCGCILDAQKHATNIYRYYSIKIGSLNIL